jgi:hypothetical protein
MLTKVALTSLVTGLTVSLPLGALVHHSAAQRFVQPKRAGATSVRKVAYKNKQLKQKPATQKSSAGTSMAEQMKKNPNMKM